MKELGRRRHLPRLTLDRLLSLVCTVQVERALRIIVHLE